MSACAQEARNHCGSHNQAAAIWDGCSRGFFDFFQKNLLVVGYLDMSAYAQEARNHCDVVCEYLPSIVTRYLIQGVNEEVKLPTEAENGIFQFFSRNDDDRQTQTLDTKQFR